MRPFNFPYINPIKKLVQSLKLTIIWHRERNYRAIGLKIGTHLLHDICYNKQFKKMDKVLKLDPFWSHLDNFFFQSMRAKIGINLTYWSCFSTKFSENWCTYFSVYALDYREKKIVKKFPRNRSVTIFKICSARSYFSQTIRKNDLR